MRVVDQFKKEVEAAAKSLPPELLGKKVEEIRKRIVKEQEARTKRWNYEGYIE